LALVVRVGEAPMAPVEALAAAVVVVVVVVVG
jgi:hypothetical protein